MKVVVRDEELVEAGNGLYFVRVSEGEPTNRPHLNCINDHRYSEDFGVRCLSRVVRLSFFLAQRRGWSKKLATPSLQRVNSGICKDSEMHLGPIQFDTTLEA